MDNNFQTSFIPKKPMTVEVSKTGSGINIFLLISIFIFIVAVLASVGIYFWHNSLKTNLEEKIASLEESQKEDPTTLENIIDFNLQLELVDKLLSRHVAVSPLFDYLQKNTVQGVRFKSFTFTAASDSESGGNLKMSGIAKDFNTIAGQSDAFKRSPGIINPIFSDFTPTVTGAVSFGLSATLDSDLTNYKAQIEKNTENSSLNQFSTSSQIINNF